MRRSAINNVIFMILKLNNSLKNEFFHQGLYRELLSKMGFFVKVNCCMFDQSFLFAFDGKYGSAAALLVFPTGVQPETG